MTDGTDGAGRRMAINPEDALDVVKNADVPFLSTGQVADNLDATPPTVRDRLQTLEEQGRLESHTVGRNIPVWYLPGHRDRLLREYEDDGGGDTPRRPPSDDSDLATAGGAVGDLVDELSEFREELNQSQERHTQRLEAVEQKVARVEADAETGEDDEVPEEPLTIAEWAERERRVSWRVFSRVGVIVTVTILILAFTGPWLSSYSVPLFGTVYQIALLFGVGLTISALAAGTYWGVFKLLTKTGVAGRLTTTWLGEWYKKRQLEKASGE